MQFKILCDDEVSQKIKTHKKSVNHIRNSVTINVNTIHMKFLCFELGGADHIPHVGIYQVFFIIQVIQVI